MDTIEDWKKYIKNRICGPINNGLNGKAPADAKAVNYQSYVKGKIWYVAEDNDLPDLLDEVFNPLLEEYLFRPQFRMADVVEDKKSEESFWVVWATNSLKTYIENLPSVLPLFEGKNAINVIEDWITADQFGFDRFYYNQELFLRAINDDWQLDWDKLSEKVDKVLQNCPSDYDKTKLQYYCFLDAVIKISTYESIDYAVRQDWYQKICKQWNLLTPIYSVMTGCIINSKYNHISYLVGQYKNDKKEYASLMVAALKHHPQVLKSKNSKQIAKEVEDCMREIRQKTDLHGLCACLFPSDKWDEYNVSSTRMSTVEMLERIRFLENAVDSKNEETRLMEQRKLEALAESMREQLGKSISMDDLEAAILQSPPAMANMIFTQLDLRLEDVCDVWTKCRKELKRKVLALERNDSNIISETYDKVSAIEKKPSEVKYIYEQGSTHVDNSKNLLMACDIAPETLQLDK